ncbi:zinc finger protein 518B [Hyla sarda]|uniref:zinc finger protein 518B n=1 Tax=Hyla sarda TaxID=327740 RepID=UPI0024C470EF|nr:zinc finger protein 518B [Hyla sarda]XP_056411123.1 zinc finger protein 518B [Hyla sarda]XP_056411124.1 zinc finger protein 518B [Hyla sarda]XP_056411125.1 zinc finger protein 518B [Hyla sarda]XP_056411126.1 zinc finger protein 518B [Hyla sarda]XP_056411127.1 zinc finger protein 518B [Hyla sarda]XP_056411128.1 zinc finger protein 518B [Hyla sarda]XP_056411129.1 zinc finger protein 518B [Hyla sarda]XP_056411130.1 zinc finger protein 518B [Hyla sarda]
MSATLFNTQMYSSTGIPSFIHKPVLENSKYVTQTSSLCEQARNLGTGIMMNSMLQKQMLEKFNCEKCRFSTKDLNKYRNHVSLHNDIKYTCSHCDFMSYTKTEFQRHLVSHTGKFPYTCGYCGYGAIRNDYIVKHIRRIHGDGKIHCSVSTIENESKKASVNIMQTQVIGPNVQNILQNSSTTLTEEIIDLTEGDSLSTSSNIFPNGNNVEGNVEVEVISPADQQLYPWIPLTVVAPTSFKVPPNCIAQVVEVKPVNSACHLVLKCLNLVEASLPTQPVTSENIYEQKPSGLVMPPKNMIETPELPSVQECTLLRDNCQENILYPPDTVCGTQEDLPKEVATPIDTTTEVVDPISTVANDVLDDLEEFTGGPIISAVFSLSSDSQNSIEGIQWECPFSSPNTSSSHDSVDVTQPSSNQPASQEKTTVKTTVYGNELNSEMDIEKSQDEIKNTVSESNKEAPEIERENVKQNTDSEIQLSTALILTDVKKAESQPFVSQKIRKGGRISDRLGKIETDRFSKPQVLFLSCDKRIVMQPLSCTMQSTNNQTSLVDKVTEQLQVPVKTRKSSAKVKVKRLVAPALKNKSQPNLKTLRLHPVKVDQVTHTPCYNQPVVVLNHPDVESIETSHIMKAIRVFRGKITRVTLSKKMFKKKV